MRDDAGRRFEARPALLLLANPQRLRVLSCDGARFEGAGVLLDVPKRRALVGPPYLLRSTLTHLLYLDGRYARHFQKVSDCTEFRDERVITWRVCWPAD